MTFKCNAHSVFPFISPALSTITMSTALMTVSTFPSTISTPTDSYDDLFHFHWRFDIQTLISRIILCAKKPCPAGDAERTTTVALFDILERAI